MILVCKKSELQQAAPSMGSSSAPSWTHWRRMTSSSIGEYLQTLQSMSQEPFRAFVKWSRNLILNYFQTTSTHQTDYAPKAPCNKTLFMTLFRAMKGVSEFTCME